MKKEGKTITRILRMTPGEHDKILAKISKLGGITFTKYAMSSILSRPLTKTPITRELVLELSRQGNNLNQISRNLNQGKPLDRIALTIINESLERLNAIFDLLSKQDKEQR